MPIFSNQLAGASGQAGGYSIGQSVFFDGSSTSMTRTPGSAGDRRKATLSVWVQLNPTGFMNILTPGVNGNAYGLFRMGDNGAYGYGLTVGDATGGSFNWLKRSKAIFRDPSAFYHYFVTIDTTDGTAEDRCKVFINGTRITDFSPYNTNPSLNYQNNFNNTVLHTVGRDPYNGTYANGYIADLHWIDGQPDGQALAPTDFAETNDDGVWVPKRYEGSYGSLGFHITGEDSADLGADYSGNNNDFASVGLTSDNQETNTPTNVKIIWNQQQNQRQVRTVTGASYKYTGSTRTLCGTTIHIPPTGKWVAAFSASSIADSDWQIGLLSSTDTDFGDAVGSNEDVAVGFGPYPGSQYLAKNNTVAAWYSGVTEDANDTIWIAVDADNDEQWAGVYDDSASAMVWFGSGGTSGDIATRTNPTDTGYIAAVGGSVQFCACARDSVVLTLLDIEDAPGYSSIPTDYKSLSTANLPAPTIADGSKYFNSYTWTGNGGGQRIASFQPITETYTIDNSARFNDDDSAYLSDTQGTATDSNRWTWSAWVKRGLLGSNTTLFNVRSASTDAGYLAIKFLSSDQLYITGWYTVWKQSTEVFKDASLWNHIVVAADTDQVTAADRIKIYVNGRQLTSFSPNNNPSSGSDIGMNTSSAVLEIGRDYGGSQYLDAYLADVHFIDGQQLAPSNFGQTDSSTNRWIPKAYSGSYGNNGFFLGFGDSAALGDDTSGNTNDFTSSGLASTDQMLDTPTKNYATLDPNEMSSASGVTLKDGNLNADATATATDVNSTLYATSGKWYVEYTMNAVDSSTSNPCVGIQTQSFATSPKINIDRSGSMTVNGTTTSLTGFSYTTSDIVMIAFDMDADKFWIGKNGTWYNSGDPGAGTGETTSFGPAGQAMTPFIRSRNASDVTINFGQSAFSYTAPTGFNQLNTDNLPLTGGNISAFTWIKTRSTTYSHRIYDRVRGPGKVLNSDTTNAEATAVNGLQEFLLDGFQLGSNNSENASGQTFVAWNWMTDVSGSGSLNQDGSIDSVVLADQTAGFSVVEYSGQGAQVDTVGHGLGQPPKVIICKSVSQTSNWFVYPGFAEGYVSDPETDYVYLNTTGTLADFTFWGDTAPTSSVFTVNSSTNNSGDMIAYCWAEIPFYSRFSNYVGNGNVSGSFVYTGFRPSFVMIRSISNANSWTMYDTARQTFNPDGRYILAESSAAEVASTTVEIAILSNGFQVLDNQNNINGAGRTYAYMAWAEHPFGGDGVAPVTAR
ncbi:MAG: hypothetical protein EBV86_07650 [Marivivens sp.]|nr:hypothetical protein [Marivivens sp.]NCW68433.1 hypothetical protein [Marivivens sp.]